MSLYICGMNTANKESKVVVNYSFIPQIFIEPLLCAGPLLGAEGAVPPHSSEQTGYLHSWSSHPRTRADNTTNKCEKDKLVTG